MKRILYFIGRWIHIIIFILLIALQYELYSIWKQEKINQENVLKVISEAVSPNKALLYVNEMTNSYMNANNCFDKFLSSHKEEDMKDYKSSLGLFSLYLDSLQNLRTKNMDLVNVLKSKENISLKLINLRRQLDSLINDDKPFEVATQFDNISLPKYNHTISYDTILLSIDTASRKKGFFGRLGEAFSGDSKTETRTYLIQMKVDGKSVDFKNPTQTQKIFSQNKTFQKVKETYNAVLKQNADLIKINEKILSETKEILQYYAGGVDEFTKQKNRLFVGEILKHNESQHNKLKYILLCCIAVTIMLLIYTLLITNYEKNLGEARSSAEKKAQITNKILGFLSHEIRTPFNIIQSMTEKISEAKQLGTKEQKMLNSVQFSSNSINRIIQQVLDFIKTGDENLTKNESNFALGQEISEILFSLRVLADYKKLYLIDNNEIDPNIIVSGDRGKLDQIFYNIVFNCIKFTSEGGATVTSKAQTEKDGRIKLSVEVKDTGIGIDKDEIAHIFDEYYQGDRQKTVGIGLGLSICKDIVDLHDGTISVKSEKGEGTTFYFTLYYDPAKQTGELNKGMDDSDLDKLKGLKMVISEDDEVMRNILMLSLSKYQIDYQSYNNAEDSYEYLQDHKVDIVITDIELPGMSGIDLLHKIRKTDGGLNQKTPFVAITGDISQKETFIKKGFYDVIFKPFNISELCETVSSAVQESMSPKGDV